MDMIQDWMIINKIKMGDPDAWDILVHCDNYWRGGIYCTVTYLSRP